MSTLISSPRRYKILKIRPRRVFDSFNDWYGWYYADSNDSLSLSEADTSQQPLVARPDVGTVGQRFRLLANHFRLGDIPDITIYQYAIEMVIDGFPVEKKIPAKFSREILSADPVQHMLGAAKNTFVFDGLSSRSSDQYLLGSTMAWSKNKIADFTVNITRGRREVTFSLKNTTKFALGVVKQFISKKARISNSILEAVNFLNHIFATGPTLSLIPVGRKFFTNSDVDIRKFGFIEFRRGLFQAVHFGGETSLTLNIDITTGVFWNSDCVTALDLASHYLNIPPNGLSSNRVSTQQLQHLSRAFKGLKYRVKHRGDEFSRRQYTIAKVVQKSAKEHRFQMDSDYPKTISVDEYMKNTYNLKLRYPDAILLMKGDSTYLPLELCYIVPVYCPYSII